MVGKLWSETISRARTHRDAGEIKSTPARFEGRARKRQASASREKQRGYREKTVEEREKEIKRGDREEGESERKRAK